MFQLPRFHRLIHNGGMMFVEIKQPYLGHQKLAPWRHNLTVSNPLTLNTGSYRWLWYVLEPHIRFVFNAQEEKPGCIYPPDGSVSLAYMYIHKGKHSKDKTDWHKIPSFYSCANGIQFTKQQKKKFPTVVCRIPDAFAKTLLIFSNLCIGFFLLNKPKWSQVS